MNWSTYPAARLFKDLMHLTIWNHLLAWMQTSVHPQNIYLRQVPHVLFRHREAFPFYFLVLENFGTLLDFGDLKKESRWTVWGPQLFRKDSPCTCKCHFSVETMTEIYIKWAVNEVREKLGYLKTRAPPIILRTYYTWERQAWKSLAGCDSLSTLLAPSSRYLENSGSCKLLNPLLPNQGADR